jgi:hypothetical protein
LGKPGLGTASFGLRLPYTSSVGETFRISIQSYLHKVLGAELIPYSAGRQLLVVRR